jgi:hypothetical protein
MYTTASGAPRAGAGDGPPSQLVVGSAIPIARRRLFEENKSLSLANWVC